ncbi:hypothetical protein ACLB2K_001598 [Fragaria x ananassa]
MSDYLPEEVYFKILSRLPAKSLMRFKCVSKRWRSLISDSHFAKTHLHQTLTHGFLVCTSPHIPQLESSVLESPSFGDRSSARKLAFPSKLTEEEEERLHVMLLGSCNGFVFACLRRLRNPCRNYSIWNPTTGFFMDLPDPKFPDDEEDEFFHRLDHHGIGYLQETDEYKVVVSAAGWNIMKVLSLRDQNWREITYPHMFVHEPEGVGLHETLYWVASDNEPDPVRESEPYLIAFELRNEDFRIMQLPMASIAEDENLALFSWRGCLCLWVYRTRSAQTVQCWVMEKCGDADSWTRSYKFGVPNPPVWTRYLRPLLITENSRVLVRYSVENSSKILELVKVVDKEENQEEEVVTYTHGWHGRRFQWGSLMIVYDETLFCSVMVEPKQPERKGKKLKTQHQGLTKLK